jgi:hypothetical protein
MYKNVQKCAVCGHVRLLRTKRDDNNKMSLVCTQCYIAMRGC